MTERRIVSLLPSATEILFELGLGDAVVGVTFECDFPAEARSTRIVSNTALPEGLSPAEIDAVVKERVAAGEDLYRLDAGAFADLDPTLVVTQDLCAVCAVDVSEVGDALAHLGCSAEVLTLDPMSLDEVLATILRTGDATGARSEAEALVTRLRARLDDLHRKVESRSPRRALVLEWTDPAFSAGHWVPDLVTAGGGEPLLSRPGAKSEGLDWDRVRNAVVDVVLVAPCGYRLAGAAELAEQVLAAGHLPPDAEVWALDADAHIVRPGPRVVEGAEIIARILHPDACGAPAPHEATRVR